MHDFVDKFCFSLYIYTLVQQYQVDLVCDGHESSAFTGHGTGRNLILAIPNWERLLVGIDFFFLNVNWLFMNHVFNILSLSTGSRPVCIEFLIRARKASLPLLALFCPDKGLE